MKQETFPRETTGLSEATRPEVVELKDGDEFDLRIEPVAKRIGDETVRMLAYNGSIPGPTLRVRQGAKLIVHVANEGDLEATVHWHGLRLENRFDGTHETQSPIHVGETFTYELSCPARLRVLASRTPRARPHARRRPDRGRESRRLHSGRDDARGDGALRQRHARLR